MSPRASGIEETQKNIGFLAVEIDRLRNADQLDFTPGPNCSKRRQAPRQIAAGNPFHRGDADDLRLAALARTNASSERAGMAIHLLDMFEQALRFAPHCDALPAAIEQLHRQQGFEPADPPANCGMVEPSASWRPHGHCHAGQPQGTFSGRPISRRLDSLSIASARSQAGSLQQLSTGWCKITP